MKSGAAWFGARSRYWRERVSCCEENWLLDMWGVPTKSLQVLV